MTDTEHLPIDKPLDGVQTLEQVGTIFKLVSIAENDSTTWWNNYTYCENIKDGRGYTVGLVGFCSGTGDLLEVVQDVVKEDPTDPIAKFLPVLRRIHGSSVKGLEGMPAVIKTLGADKTWDRAQWDVLVKEYWKPAHEACVRHDLSTALAQGFMFDIALNHGAEWCEKFAAKVPKSVVSEGDFLGIMISLRQAEITKHGDTTNSGQPDRCLMWKSILAKRNMDLHLPILVRCYGDTFNIVS